MVAQSQARKFRICVHGEGRDQMFCWLDHARVFFFSSQRNPLERAKERSYFSLSIRDGQREGIIF